jgi:hypothetical protein
VTGNSFDLPSIGVSPKGMRAALAFQVTSMSPEMSEQFIPFHPRETISREASDGIPRSASSLLSSRIKSIA